MLSPSTHLQTRSSVVLAALTAVAITSCTNVAFVQTHEGSRGIDFTKGTCVVNDSLTPYTKDETIKLTSIAMEKLHDMSDSVVLIKSVRSKESIGHKISIDLTTGLVDSLKKYTSYVYLLNIDIQASGSSDDLYVERTSFADDEDSKAYLNNEAIVTIVVFDIQKNTQLYKQEITASEMVDTESSLKDDESKVLFTRSTENIAKNGLVRGLRDLKKHSKKLQ